jgi:hypothetical protein
VAGKGGGKETGLLPLLLMDTADVPAQDKPGRIVVHPLFTRIGILPREYWIQLFVQACLLHVILLELLPGDLFCRPDRRSIRLPKEHVAAIKVFASNLRNPMYSGRSMRYAPYPTGYAAAALGHKSERYVIANLYIGAIIFASRYVHCNNPF